jgi:hypothetical protein
MAVGVGGTTAAQQQPLTAPTTIASLVNADAEAQSAAEYAQWLDRELAHLVGAIEPLGLEPRSLLVELCNPPGGHYLSGDERGHMRMFREQAWRQEYFRALQRIATALEAQPALWGVSILSEPAAGRTPSGRQVWRHVATQAGQLLNLWLPEAQVVIEPIDGAIGEYSADGFQPIEGVDRLAYGFVPSDRLYRAVSTELEAGRDPLRHFDFGTWLSAVDSWKARTGRPMILTGQRPLAPESAVDGATVLRVRLQREHGVHAPLEMLVGMPLNHERSIVTAPVEQVTTREAAALEEEHPSWRALLRAPRRVLPVPVDPVLVDELPVAQADRRPESGSGLGRAAGAANGTVEARKRDPGMEMQDADAVAARNFGLAALTRHAGLTRSPSTLIVRWRAGDPQTYKHSVRAMVGDGSHLELSEELDIEMLALRVPPHVAAERLAPFVEDIDPDLRLTLCAPQAQGPLTPNDPLYPSQYGLHSPGGLVQGEGLQWHDAYTNADINAPQAWALRTDASAVRIAVIDSGPYDHVDFYDVDPVTGGKLAGMSNLWINQQEANGTAGTDDDGNGYIDDVRGWNYMPDTAHPSNDPFTGELHGTKVAGIIGARGNSGRGIAGVAWKCQIVPVRAFTDAGIGTSSFAISALEYCRLKGFEIVNCSWHTSATQQDQVSTMRNQLQLMQSTTYAPRGQLVIAAAGNENKNLDALPAGERIYPACFTDLSNLLVVGASDFQDQSWLEPRPPATPDPFVPAGSNYGATLVHLYAPGRAIWSLAPGVSELDPNFGLYSPSKDGTSFAAPHVAGVASLVWAHMSGTTWNYTDVRARLLNTVRAVPASNSISVRCTSGGIVDACSALQGVPSQLPQVTILEPQNDPGINEVQRLAGEPIVFTMSATDPDQAAPIPASDTFWTSSLLGGFLALDTYSFTTSNLSPGVHTIGASAVEDNGSGRVVTALRTVRIVLATAPAAPSNLSVTSGGVNTAIVRWQDNSTNETSFEIQRQRSVGNGQWSNTTPFWAEDNQEQYTDVHGASTYRYRVRARNGGANSAWTPWVVEP